MASVRRNLAEVVVALGGDGFMLRTLHRLLPVNLPVYGMKIGNVGFLMNLYREDGLMKRLSVCQLRRLEPPAHECCHGGW